MELAWKRFTIAGFGLLLLFLFFESSPAARAEKGANWMVKGTNVSAALKPKAQAQEIEGSELPLRALFTFGGQSTDYRCAKLELVEFALLTEGSSTGKVIYTGCKLFAKGVEFAACAPLVEGKFGVVETVKLKALLVLHKLEGGTVDPLIRVEPSEGSIFTTIFVSEECNFGGGTFGGVVYLKDHNGKLAVEESTHLLEEGPLTKFFFVNEKSPAALDGKATFGLIGEHAGMAWSGLPA